ncbi:MAG: acylphosphatase [Gammaproteobacteria bacterium]|nr:acylphosphatase [Gammaproteobacteria bacterium]
MARCVRCWVSGKVQGVFFRRATRQQALSLGLAGWARNLPDGRVEVVASGEEVQVQALCDWLRVGPPHARVTEVVCEPAEIENLSGFEAL